MPQSAFYIDSQALSYFRAGNLDRTMAVLKIKSFVNIKRERRLLAMKKFAVCPSCGQKLCKAEPGSVVEMICPNCKRPVEVIVQEAVVMTKDREAAKAAT